MELYYIALHEVDRTMRHQFGAPETHDRQLERLEPIPERSSRVTRARLRASAILYGLANALDPTLVAPRGASHQP